MSSRCANLSFVRAAIAMLLVCTVYCAAADPPLPGEFDRLQPAIREIIEKSANEVRAAPDDPQQWIMLGMVYQANRQEILAEECYQEATRLDPASVRAHYYLAMLEYRRGNTMRAIELFDETLDIAPDTVSCYWRKALCLLDDGRAEEAVEFAEQALEMARHDQSAIMACARVASANRNDERVVELLNAAKQRWPSDRYIRLLLGKALQRLGEREAAERELALARGSGDRWPRQRWPDAWMLQINQFERGPVASHNQAHELMRQGKPEEALEHVREVLQNNPEDFEALHDAGRIYRELKQLDASVEMLADCLSVAPEYPAGHLEIAKTYIDMVRAEDYQGPITDALDRAKHHIAKSIELNPHAGEPHGVDGIIKALENDHAGAAEALLTALRYEPGNPIWRYRAGWFLVALQRWEEAAETLSSFEHIDPPYQDSLYLLGVSLAALGRLEDAERVARLSIERSPGDQRVEKLLESILQARQQ